MPTIRIEMLEGRTPEQKAELVRAITETTVKVLDCSPQAVDILIYDIPKNHWATGGKLWSEPRE